MGLRDCKVCGKVNSSKACGNGCGTRYCSQGCQSKDWKAGHKELCPEICELTKMFEHDQTKKLECPVCMEEFEGSVQSRVVPVCGHAVCGSCWVKLNGTVSCRFGGIRPGLLCVLCRAPTTFNAVFDVLCERRPESFVEESNSTPHNAVNLCASVFSAFAATNRAGLLSDPFELGLFVAKNQSLLAKFTNICQPQLARKELFSSSPIPTWKQGGAKWYLREWYNNIFVVLFGRTEDLQRLALSWFYVWSHAAWSVVDVPINCYLSHKTISLSVSMLSKFTDVGRYLDEHRAWDRLTTISQVLFVNNRLLADDTLFGGTFWSALEQQQWPPTIERLPALSNDSKAPTTVFDASFWFDGHDEDPFYSIRIAGSVDDRKTPLIKPVMEKMLNLKRADASVGSLAFELMHTHDVHASVTWETNKEFIFRFGRIESFQYFIPTVHIYPFEDFFKKQPSGYVVVRRNFPGEESQFVCASACYILFCMRQMQGSEASEANLRVFTQLKQRYQQLPSLISLPEIDTITLETPRVKVCDIIVTCLAEFYTEDSEQSSSLVAFISELANATKFHSNGDAPSRLTVYHIVCKGGNHLCVPMIHTT